MQKEHFLVLKAFDRLKADADIDEEDPDGFHQLILGVFTEKYFCDNKQGKDHSAGNFQPERYTIFADGLK